MHHGSVTTGTAAGSTPFHLQLQTWEECHVYRSWRPFGPDPYPVAARRYLGNVFAPSARERPAAHMGALIGARSIVSTPTTSISTMRDGISTPTREPLLGNLEKHLAARAARAAAQPGEIPDQPALPHRDHRPTGLPSPRAESRVCPKPLESADLCRDASRISSISANIRPSTISFAS